MNMSSMKMNMNSSTTPMAMSSMHDMSGHQMGGMPPMDMGMYFHIGYEKHVLFKNWVAQSDGAVFGFCVLFFTLALAYELLKYYRELHLSSATVIRYSISEENGTNSTVTQDSQIESIQTSERPIHLRESPKRLPMRMMSIPHVVQTALHMIQIFVSYILMLAFMLFNVWICLAIILGAGVGYFLVGSRRLAAYSAIDEDHCH